MYILKYNYSIMDNDKNYTHMKEFKELFLAETFVKVSEVPYKIYNYEIVEK